MFGSLQTDEHSSYSAHTTLPNSSGLGRVKKKMAPVEWTYGNPMHFPSGGAINAPRESFSPGDAVVTGAKQARPKRKKFDRWPGLSATVEAEPSRTAGSHFRVKGRYNYAVLSFPA